MEKREMCFALAAFAIVSVIALIGFSTRTAWGYANGTYDFANNTCNCHGEIDGTSNGGMFWPHNFYGASGGNTTSCGGCHRPHAAGDTIPLWNGENTYDGVYTSYTSPTNSLDGAVAASLGGTTSEACMSCHDGHVENAGTDPDTGMPVSFDLYWDGTNASFGGGYPNHVIDLSTPTANHPVGVAYEPGLDTGLNDAVTNGVVGGTYRLYNNEVHCPTCHDPHKKGLRTDKTVTAQLVSSYATICMDCHVNK